MTELTLRAIQAGVNVDAINDLIDSLITNHLEYNRDSSEFRNLVNFNHICSALRMDLTAEERVCYRLAVRKYLRDIWTLDQARHYVYRRTLDIIDGM